MTHHSPTLRQRPDPLRWAIYLCLFAPAGVHASGGLLPHTGPGGTPIVNPGARVPVVDIVAPTPSGLSHNQFFDYNVGRDGVVLNNALQDGQSQLAGALAANPQFHGQAASTILAEVISRNTSLIEGPQEIFGRPADYILANPNGITVNGGSFINTTRAGFLVGTPVIEEQRIKYLDTLHADGTLNILDGGLNNPQGALDLIAPRIDSHGLLEAKPGSDLTLVVGHNRIDAGNGEVLEHLPSTPSSIDAKLFGAMRAGRIRVVSTAEGAGVHVGPIRLDASDTLSIRSAGDVRLTATQGEARHIDVQAGEKLVLDTDAKQKNKNDRENWDKKAWFVTTETYSRNRQQTDTTERGTHLQASENLNLRAEGDLQMTAAKLKAGDTLALHSGGDMTVQAGVDSRKVDEQIRHRKYLWRGDQDNQQYSEKAVSSTLEAGKLVASAGKQLRVSASQLSSQDDIQLHARQVEVGEQQFKQSDNHKGYRGDLLSGTFFGDRQGQDNQASQAVGSSIRAEGKLSISADGMGIRGSSVSSAGDAVLYSDKANLTVEAAQSTRESNQHSSASQVFGLLGKRSDSKDSSAQALVSDIRSTSNLRLASADELKIQGANISAGQTLALDAKGDLRIDAAQNSNSSERSSQQRYLTASARQTQQAQDGKPDSRQFEARVGYEVANVETRQSTTEHVASSLSGASVELRSDQRLTASGAQLQASAGDLTLKASEIDLGAGRNTQDNDTSTSASGGGLALSGGIDRVGSAFEGHHDRDSLHQSTGTARPSALSASGDLRIDTQQLTSEGAQVSAAGQLLVSAKQIDNRAASDTQAREQTTRNWQGSLGASVEYRDITRPIERLVEGNEAARFQQAGIEDAMAPPNIGADLAVDHLARTQIDTQSTARPASFSGASTQVHAERILDQGTDYTASAGQLQIKADEHQLLAASDRQHHDVQRLGANAGLRVDTSTGEDINVRLEGKLGKLAEVQTTTTARPGSLNGQAGIQVQLGSDGRYEGTRMQAGNGALTLESQGDLTLAAAHDHSIQSHTQLDASLWAKGGNRPGSTGVDVRSYGDYSTRQSEDSKARVGSLEAKGPTGLTSAGDMTLEGTRIDADGDITLHSDGVLKVLAAHDTHQASGSTLGGGVELAGTAGSGTGAGIGGHLTSAKVDENDRKALKPQFTSKGALQLSSLARDDIAMQLQGVQASATRIELAARNGGLLIEAAGQHERRDNLDVTAGAGFKLNRGETRDQDVRGLHARVKVDMDKRDNQTWSDSTLRAEQIALSSRGDTRIEGAKLDAGQISGKVGGDLRVASRKDRIDSLAVAVDGRLSQEKNPQGYLNAATSLAGPAGAHVKDKAGAALAAAEPGISPTLKVQVSHQQRDTVARQTSLVGTQGIDLKVAGETHLSGAKLQASDGVVELGGGNLTQETLTGSDYRRDVAFDLSNAPVDIGTAVLDSLKHKGAADGENALDLGLLRTSGHSRNAEWTSRIENKR